MKNQFRQLANDVRAGRNPEQTLPMIMTGMSSVYGQLAFYNLAMELSVYLESVKEGRIKPEKGAKECFAAIRETLELLLQPGHDPELHRSCLERLFQTRSKVVERMEILTAYTDTFILYEYILNRLEPKFVIRERKEEDNDTVAREILKWIFSDEEHALINERIKLSLFNLPVRMTKGKLLELVENAFSLYREADRASLEMFDYMLRSAAGLYQPKGMAKSYPKLARIKKELAETEYAELTEEQFASCRALLSEATETVRNLTECFQELQEMLNDLLTVLLTRPYFDLTAEQTGKKVCTMISALLKEEPDPEQLFCGVEQEMERLAAEVSEWEALFDEAGEREEARIRELMLSTEYERLRLAQRLNSGSTYAALEEKTVTDTPEGYALQVRERLLKDLKDALERGSRWKNRAVTAAVLRELPVYFNNHTEVMEYVRNALNNCHEEEEKEICIELLRSCYQ